MTPNKPLNRACKECKCMIPIMDETVKNVTCGSCGTDHEVARGLTKTNLKRVPTKTTHTCLVCFAKIITEEGSTETICNACKSKFDVKYVPQLKHQHFNGF